MSGASAQLLTQFGFRGIGRRDFLRSAEDIEQASAWLPDAHSVRRAWEKMRLAGVFCVDRKPTVYFKEVGQIRSSDIRSLHRRVWNQGIATLLVVASPKEVQVYSGLSRPAGDDDDPRADDRLVVALDRTADALRIRQLIRQVKSGQIYQEKPRCFDRDHTVDQYLLRNLRAATQQLRKVTPSLPDATIHGLLCRTIFACYLTDRKIVSEAQFTSAGAPGVASLRELLNSHAPSKAKPILYRFFGQLRPQFNGSMFDDKLTREREFVTAKHIDVLGQFLRGDDLGERQLSLGFWAYDFNFIPVETISAIYEEFLGAESEDAGRTNAESQRASGAYYTPKHLAELVVDTALEDWDTLLDKRFLDPACGSGIFLVTIFNRIAEEWRRKNPGRRNLTRGRALREILRRNLFGVDKDEMACRITCFSLYLALLDQLEPRDIQELSAEEPFLPQLLLARDETPAEGQPRTIICGNFFDPKLPVPRKRFDLVVGNPPWVGRNQPLDGLAQRWYQDEVRQQVPQRQVAHAFMWKCPQHLAAHGRVCLLLPAKVFLNRTDEFQEKWLLAHNIDQVVQLSDMSFLLFEGADCPAMVVRYARGDGADEQHTIDYLVPKANRTDPRRGVVVISSDDRKRLALEEIVAYARRRQAPMLWKMHLWGTPRDVRLVQRLATLPALEEIVGTPRSPKRWIAGQGFKPATPRETPPKKPWWKPDHLFVEATSEGLTLILQEQDCTRIKNRFPRLHRSPDPSVFQGPMVLVSQGFSKIAFAGFDVLFRHALQSISGRGKDESLLMFLCAVLRSRLAKYFLFHTAANWGTERDKVHLFELLRLPLPLPETMADPAEARSIVDEIAKVFRQAKPRMKQNFLERNRIVEEADASIQELVYRYYDIDEWERVLIDDTCDTVLPSSTPTSLDGDIKTLRPTKQDDRAAYVAMLCKVLNTWSERSGWCVEGRTVISSATGLGIVKLRKTHDPQPFVESDADDELQRALSKVIKLLPRRSGRLEYMRGLSVFEGDTVHIIKPLALRFWTRTAAINDADELAAAILAPRREPAS